VPARRLAVQRVRAGQPRAEAREVAAVDAGPARRAARRAVVRCRPVAGAGAPRDRPGQRRDDLRRPAGLARPVHDLHRRHRHQVPRDAAAQPQPRRAGAARHRRRRARARGCPWACGPASLR
jgi:hypothetical protein